MGAGGGAGHRTGKGEQQDCYLKGTSSRHHDDESRRCGGGLVIWIVRVVLGEPGTKQAHWHMLNKRLNFLEPVLKCNDSYSRSMLWPPPLPVHGTGGSGALHA